MIGQTNSILTVLDAICRDFRTNSEPHAIAYALLTLYPGYRADVEIALTMMQHDHLWSRDQNTCIWLRHVQEEFAKLATMCAADHDSASA
jgi:hypothetical protein